MKQSQPIGILDLLQLQGFDLTQKFKLVRHQTDEHDLEDYLRRGWFDAYQAFQSRPVFDDVDFIVSFIGAGRTRARLLGVYRVLGHTDGRSGRLPEGWPHPGWLKLHRFYELRKLPGFEELENRVVIEWGKGTRAWVQRPKNKEVIELLSKGQLLRPFDDYISFR